MQQPKKHTQEPVTVIFNWMVTPGKEQEFQSWMHKVHEAALEWPGHLGVTTLRPPQGSEDYRTILRFDCAEHLESWLHSEERRALMKSLGNLAKQHTEKASGLETWFNLPGKLVVPPPRWKMAVTTIIAIYPIALFFAVLVTPHVTSWPVYVRSALVPIFGPIILTYLFMPTLTQRILRRWLYRGVA